MQNGTYLKKDRELESEQFKALFNIFLFDNHEIDHF